MYSFPIKYYEGNLIFSETGCWAGFGIVGYDYENKNVEGKLKILRSLSNFIADTVTEMKILIIPIKEKHNEELRKNYEVMKETDPLKEVARQYTEGQIDYLERKQAAKIFVDRSTGEEIKYVEDSINDYATYIIVKIDDVKEKDFIEKFQDCIEYLITDPKKAINNIFGLEDQKILESKIRAFRKASRRYFETQSQRIELSEIDNKTLQWLYRRINYRGLNDKVDVTDFEPKATYSLREDKDIEVNPRENEIRGLFRGELLQHDRYLEVVTDSGTSYQSFLPLVERPTMGFPGSEFLFLLQNIDIAAETCIHIKMLDEGSSKQVVLNERRKVSSEIENANEGNMRVDENTKDAVGEIANMEEEVRINKKLTQTSITFCISNDNLEELEKDTDRFMTIFKDQELILERPIADQYKLYMEFIPGTHRYTEDFAKIMSIESIAGMGIGVSRVLGDKDGPYIGTTGPLEKKVFLNMARAPLENKSASATFYGDLGFGKSFNANLLTIIHVIFGGYALIFDPKGERSHWIEHLPWLKDLTSITELSASDQYKGMLDPYNIYPKDKEGIEEASALALTVAVELNKLSPKDEEYTILKEKIVEMKSYDDRSMNKLIDLLANTPKSDSYYKEAEKIARNLKTLKNIGLSKLLFGDGTEESIDFDNRLNILQINNLKLPTADVKKEDYDDEEMLATTLMTVVSQFAKKFALMPRNQFKIVFFDESWFLKNNSEGKKLYAYLTRMGRSLFTGCIFNGHSVLDIPSDEIKNTISYRFCFHTSEEAEAKRMCEYLKIDISKENIERLMNLKNRECMFRDLDGRVGVLKFDAVYKDLIECFSTTPKVEVKDDEEMVAS